MQRALAYISLLICLLFSVRVSAQQHIPQHNGDKAEYNISITMPKGALSGICILVQDNDSIKGAVVNEFGVSMLDFVYESKVDKVKLKSVIAMIDKNGDATSIVLKNIVQNKPVNAKSFSLH